jgi:hypothetical protein
MSFPFFWLFFVIINDISFNLTDKSFGDQDMTPESFARRTGLGGEEYMCQTDLPLLNDNKSVITLRFIVFYPGNKKNAYASRYIIESLFEYLFSNLSKRSPTFYKKTLVEEGFEIKMANIKLFRCKGRWYKMVGAVDLKFSAEKENRVKIYLKYVKEVLSSHEFFSAVFLDFDLRESDNNLLLLLEELFSLQKKTRTILSFFKNEFYLFSYLEKQFQNFKRFRKIDEFSFSLFNSSRENKKSDHSLKIKWKIGNKYLEKHLTVSRHFCFYDCFQPRVFISIISLLSEQERFKLQNSSFTGYTFHYTRFINKHGSLSYSGKIKSKDRTFFLQLLDMTLFSLPVFQILNCVASILDHYYNENKLEITNRYYKRKKATKKVPNPEVEEKRDLSPFLK